MQKLSMRRTIVAVSVLVLSVGIRAPHGAEGAPVVLPANDADMGCCVLNSPNARCAYTNRRYCQSKAEALRVSYEFYRDTSCRDVGACPR